MSSSLEWTADEIMTLAAARQIPNGATCFVGIGLPSTAANLARLTHAPDVVLIYESGTIGAKPTRLPLSIGDNELADTADAIVSVPEIFSYWLQPGRIDIGFLGAAQLDRFGNINSTVIGPYETPKVRLPGAGGAPEIARACPKVIIVLRQQPRTFVEHLDFVTSSLTTGTPGRCIVITDLGILRSDPQDGELRMTHLHPRVSRSEAIEATSWDLRFAEAVAETAPPAAKDLEMLRALQNIPPPTDRTWRAGPQVQPPDLPNVHL
jgi:glutaconate CoA-transferase subunit B